MYKLQYGSVANCLYRKINDEWLPIGFWVVGSRTFNSERAYRHLNQAERDDSINFDSFKRTLENKGSW